MAYAEKLGAPAPKTCPDHDHIEHVGCGCDHGSGLPWEGYYYSAYGIATKHGFVGTEEEWLASLRGATGADGRGFQILGLYETLADLHTAHATGNAGDAYAVGDEDDNTIYIWDVDEEAWADIGPMRGEKGNTGDTGAAAGFGTVSATVDANVGTPAIAVTASGPDTAKQFAFAFSNIKGQPGADGTDGADGVSPGIEIASITGGHSVTVTDADHPSGQTFNVMDGEDGEDGQDGAAAGFGTPTATIDSNVGTPSISISASGPDTAKVFSFAFHNLKGEPGTDGTSFTVKGLYATLAALEAAHPTGSAGDAYAVGTDSSNTIYIWDVDTAAWTNIGSIQGPAGQDGQDGQDGADGVSPGVSIASITGGHTVTITDADHPSGQSFNVMDGTDGQDGQDGAPGPNTVTTSTTTNITGLLKGNGSVVSAATAGTDYATPGMIPAAVTANPTLAGTESALTGLEVGSTKYKVQNLSAYASNPAMDGTASPGSSADYAKGDHVHPTDTGRQAKITASGVLVGDGDGGVSAKTLDTSSLSNDNAHVPSSGVVKSAITKVETDLASIHATGSTNTTGAAIPSGTYFYLNDVLVRAKTDIAVNASYQRHNNYEVVTEGGLNDLKSTIPIIMKTTIATPSSTGSGGRQYKQVSVPSGKICVPLSFTVEHNTQSGDYYTYGAAEVPNMYVFIWNTTDGIRLQFDKQGMVTAFGGKTATVAYVIL